MSSPFPYLCPSCYNSLFTNLKLKKEWRCFSFTSFKIYFSKLLKPKCNGDNINSTGFFKPLEFCIIFFLQNYLRIVLNPTFSRILFSRINLGFVICFLSLFRKYSLARRAQEFRFKWIIYFLFFYSFVYAVSYVHQNYRVV